MSEKEALAYNEVVSPVYKALQDHIQVESAQSKSTNDVFGYSLGMIALRRTNTELLLQEDLLKSKLEEVKTLFEREDLRPLLDTELVEAMLLAYKGLADYGRNSSKYRSVVKNVLQTLSNRSWLNAVDLASYTCFACNDDKALKSETEAAAVWLGERIEQSWEKRSHVNYVSILFGTSFLETAPLNWVTMFEERRIEDLRKSALLTTRDLARLGIALLNMSDRIEIKEQLVNDIITKAEGAVKAELASDSIFLDQGLREALSLVNSGMPISEAKQAIKQVGKSWESIEISDDGKVTLRGAPPALSLPTFNVEEHSLLLMLLARAHRDRVFLLDDKNVQKAKEGTNLLTKGYMAVSRPILSFVKWSSSLLLFFSAMVISNSITGTTFSDILNLGELLAAGAVTRILALPISLLLSAYVSIGWFRFLNTAFTYGHVPRARWVGLFPFADTAYRIIKGEEQ